MARSKIANLVKILKNNGVGVLPTDTLYGLVGQALNKQVVARIKKLKKRSAGKPFIILNSSLEDLKKFKIKLNSKDQEILTKIWPGAVSVAFSKKLSFRWPKNKFLTELIKETGPLVAPSANPEGSPSASTITEAKKYFGDQIDFYWPARQRLNGQPSTLISLKNGKIKLLRIGRVKINL
jgi:L-threonylcarbamoyladenylate synthase